MSGKVSVPLDNAKELALRIRQLVQSGVLNPEVLDRVRSIATDPAELARLLEELGPLGTNQVKPVTPEEFYRDDIAKFDLRFPLDPSLNLTAPFSELDRKTQFVVLFSEWQRREMEGMVTLAAGKLNDAEVIFQECVERAKQVEVQELVARSCEDMMRVAQNKGNHEEERMWSQKAIQARKGNGSESSTFSLRSIAMVEFEEGKVPEAEESLSKLIAVIGSPKTPQEQEELCQCLISRATVRRFVNRWQEALNDLDKCEKMASRLAPLTQLPILTSTYHARTAILATPYSPVYNPGAALESIRDLQALGRKDWVVDVAEMNLALQTKDWSRAATIGLRAEEAMDSEGLNLGVAKCQYVEGRAYLELGDLQRAESKLVLALEYFQKSDLPHDLADANLALARLESARGQHDRSWEFACKALNLIESLIRRFREPGDEQRFLIDKLQYYDVAFDIGLKSGSIEGCRRAWTIAERAKSFYLCQLIANADVDLLEGVEQRVIEKLRRLENELDDVDRTLALPDSKERPRKDELEDRRRRTSNERQEVLFEIMKMNPRWAALRTPPNFDLDAALLSLGPTWVSLCYFWRENDEDDGATLYVFSNIEGTPRVNRIPWSREELARLEDCRGNLRGVVTFVTEVFPQELAEKILPKEIWGGLRAEQHLLVSPHGHLQTIPIHAISLNGKEPLISRWPVQYIPTLVLASFGRTVSPRSSVLLAGCTTDAFGDPALDDVVPEIEELYALWQEEGNDHIRKCIVSSDRSLTQEGAPIESWHNYDLIHLACHGVFPIDRPFDAAVRLGTDEVRASRFFTIRLGASLVILSACSLGQQAPRLSKLRILGDEWIGLYLPLLYSGVRTLLVSLWNAESTTARRFMIELHKGLREGDGAALALQSAAMSVMKDADLQCWANWYLVGLPG